MAGLKATVVWHTMQSPVVGMCLADFPVAFTPLWQDSQLLVIPVWSNTDVTNDVVEWQAMQSFVVGIWLAGMPRLITPLWQVAQLLVMPAWLKIPVANVP